MLPLGNKEPINGSVSIVMSLSSLVNPPGNQTNPKPQPQRSRPDPGAKRRHAIASGFKPRNERTDEGQPRSGARWNQVSCHRSAHTTTTHIYETTVTRSPNMFHLPPLHGFGDRCDRLTRTEVRGYRMPSLRDCSLSPWSKSHEVGQGWTASRHRTGILKCLSVR